MENIVVMADIHGNLPALDAVLRETAKLEPTAYLVLGDCFGELGQAGWVMERLYTLRAFCLLGNRERDMLAYLRGEKPGWEASMQVRPLVLSAGELKPRANILTRWPMTAGLGDLRLCHGSVQDVYEILHPGLPRLDGMLRQIRENTLLAGHDHKQWAYALEGKRACGVGSVGLAHTGRPCQAQYVVMSRQGERDEWTIHFRQTTYDGRALTALMKKSGWLRAAGPVARAAYEEALTGGWSVVGFVNFAGELCRRRLGEVPGLIPDDILEEAARRYPWVAL